MLYPQTSLTDDPRIIKLKKKREAIAQAQRERAKDIEQHATLDF